MRPEHYCNTTQRRLRTADMLKGKDMQNLESERRVRLVLEQNRAESRCSGVLERARIAFTILPELRQNRPL